jgi:hypothetical protein
MLYFKCKCGRMEFFGSGMCPALCDVCPTCGTTMLKDRDGNYFPPEPHKYKTKYNPDTGAPYERCTVCHQTREEIERSGGRGIDPGGCRHLCPGRGLVKL